MSKKINGKLMDTNVSFCSGLWATFTGKSGKSMVSHGKKIYVDFLLVLLIVCEILQKCYGTSIYGNQSVTLKVIFETVLNKERTKQKRTKAMWLCRNH